MSKQTETKWYQVPKNEMAERLGTHLSNGLDRERGKELLKTHGRNELVKDTHESAIEKVVNQLKSPLAFILLCAGIVTTLLGEYVDSTVIFLALIVNVLISMYQEGRASQAFEKLKSSQQKYAVVMRSGEKERIAAEDVVPGDCVVLETGMNVPADARLIVSNDLEVNESALTGEWVDVAKHAKHIETLVPISDQKNMVFMGTLVTGGSGTAIVVQTGNRTAIGSIATSLGNEHAVRTPLQDTVASIARFLSYIIFAALIGIFALGLLRGEPLTELLLISIAIAVAAIPEGLPAAVTVVLAIGMEAVLKRGGLVRNMLAAETLGSTTVILTDKTGTLTMAEMQVSHVVTLGTILLERSKKDSGVKVHEAHGDERDVLEYATLASDAFIEKRENPDVHGEEERIVRGRPVERAIVGAALRSGMDQTELLKNYPRLDYLPFESRYRAAFSLNRVRGMKHQRIYVTGAPEFLLDSAKHVYLEGRTHAKTEEIMHEFHKELMKYTQEGMRLIAVAYHDVAYESFPREEEGFRDMLTDQLVFAGYIVLHDPLREDVPASIAIAKRAGTRIMMATGDNPETARTIAEEAGIWMKGHSVMTGSEIEKLDDAELIKQMKGTTVFARMLPEHKLRLIRLLEADGEVVAMTGDGVNDAPALIAANIGVALGSGTEVAKEASDLILLNNSFSIIVSAIEEGRRVIDNLRKIVAYLLSTSFSEIIVVALALIAGLPIPLLPTQILWTNMFTEGFMNFAFAFEPKEPDLMQRDPRVSGARYMLSRKLIGFIITVGITTGMSLFLLFVLSFKVFENGLDETRTLLFMALTLGTTFVAFSLKDLRTPLYRINVVSNWYLVGSVFVAVAGLAVALSVPFVSMLLHLTPLATFESLPLIVLAIAANILLVEIAKYFFFIRSSAR